MKQLIISIRQFSELEEQRKQLLVFAVAKGMSQETAVLRTLADTRAMMDANDPIVVDYLETVVPGVPPVLKFKIRFSTVDAAHTIDRLLL
jgi:hypothetical protein